MTVRLFFDKRRVFHQPDVQPDSSPVAKPTVDGDEISHASYRLELKPTGPIITTIDVVTQ